MSFDLNSPTFYTDVIGQAITQLEGFRSTTKKPAELEWEIRLYRWILAQPDAEKKAAAYFKAQAVCGYSKRDRVAYLGWSIE